MLRRRGLFTAVGGAMLLISTIGTPSAANAAWWSKLWPTAWWSRSHDVPAIPTTHPTPEIDPGMLRAGLVLLGGGLAVLTDRRRRRG